MISGGCRYKSICNLGMANSSKNLGNWGEAFAAEKLKSAGYRILKRNWRSKAGEIDIVAENSGFIIFVEVKTRRTSMFGIPSDAISKERLKRIHSAAQIWPNPDSKSLRVDVFTINLEDRLQFEHFEGVTL